MQKGKSIPNKTLSDDIEKYQGRLRNFIRKRCQSAEDAKDILQDVLFQLANADFLRKPVENTEAWLFTVARRKIIDWYKKKHPDPLFFTPDDDDDNDFMNDINSILFEEGNTPEDEFLKSLIWERLYTALSQLPREQRQVFEQNELEGLSFKTISKQSGTPVNTLISRKRYATLFLREQLKELYDELIEY
jgi:RNA polymerase sigma factor (sigma-70 family)